MPTNEERREVAARLREPDIIDEVAFSECWLPKMFDVSCKDFGFSCGACIKHVTNRLADLIEPEPEMTCCKALMTWFFPATELTSEREVEYFGCSWCGEYLSDTDCYGLDDGPNYCSNCGRPVDKSFVIDEITGEVIYRDGAKVVE